MKKKDFTLIVVIIVISAAISFFLATFLFGDPETDPMTVERAEAIDSAFNDPDEKFFNEDAINPTQLIRIGDDEGNVSPFGQAQ